MSKQHVRVELYHDFEEGGVHKRSWVARAPYTRDQITVERDRGDEQAEPTTGSATLTFPGHDLNPNNVASPLYGMIGPNTPLRILAGPAAALTDPFDRTVTDGWNTTRYTFDSTSEGWAGEGATSVARVTSPVHDGAGSLQATKTMGAGFDSLRFNDASGLPDDISAGGDTITVWAQVPAGAAGSGWLARIEVQDPSFTWISGADVAMTPGTWTLLEFTPPAGLLANCRAVGVQFSATGVAGSQSVYIDTVAQYDAGAPLWGLSGGTNPGDYDVNGFEGTHTHTDTGVYRISSVDTGSTDHLVRAIFDLSASDVTGNPATVQIRGRKADNDNYYALEAQYATSEVVTVQLAKRVAGVGSVISGAAAVPFTGGGSGGGDMIGELYVEGNRIYGKVWYRYVDEPLAWMVSAEDKSLTAGTKVALSGRRETGNTNTNLQIRWHDFLAVPGTIRFAGECASFKPRRALGDVEYGVDGVPVKGDRWVNVTANGVLRRMGQGDPPALSALWVENLFNNPIAFWPITDGVNATQAASALPGGTAMDVYGIGGGGGTLVVPPLWSPVSYNSWVEPLATPDTGAALFARGRVNQAATDTQWAGDFVFTFSTETGFAYLDATWHEDKPAGARIEWYLSLYTEETSFITWELYFIGAGDAMYTLVDDGTVAVKDGRIHHARVTTVLDGADVDWQFLVDNTSLGSGTVVGADWAPVGLATLQLDAETISLAAGFVTVWDTSPPFNAANAAAVGRSGETAAARLARLCLQNGIAFELIGDAADTVPMGPQPIKTFVGNVAQIESTDASRIVESRHQVGLTMRTRATLYNQTAAPTLDVDDEGVAPDLAPDVDDLGVVNDVTVVRTDGSSARSVDEDGPLGVATIGRYPRRFDINPEVDESLAVHADWRRNLYSQKATRYPQVVVDLDAVPSLMQAAARVDSGDVIALDNAEPDQARLMVLGYTETIGSHRRKIAYNAGPAKVFDSGVYNDSGTRWDTPYSTTTGTVVTGTTTSVSVATQASRTLWVTGSTGPQFPFEIEIEGARLSVTAISGASSPQTFTVTAAPTNGVIKTIAAGAQVRLANPKRYGF